MFFRRRSGISMFRSLAFPGRAVCDSDGPLFHGTSSSKEEKNFSSFNSLSRARRFDTENQHKHRCDSLESWSILLETSNVENQEAQEPWMADLSQLFIGNKFASGTYSRIYRGIYKQRAVAIKIIKVPETDENMETMLENQFTAEIALLARLYHPNIVQFIAASKKPPIYCIITEYMSQGTLRMYLNKRQPYSLDIETILKFALDISRGMEYLHSNGVIHRDLKSDNLLLNDEMQVKVADFGTSCLETESHELKSNAGTYRWMAPEMIMEKPYTKKVDVYSFGIVLWELTTCLMPFEGKTPVQAAYAASQKNERPALAENCPPTIGYLIKLCWAANPNKRPDFHDIVSVLEKFEKCVKDGVPLQLKSSIKSSNVIFDRLKSFMSRRSSVSVNA